ncbi:choice-of-anchor J domain-containing protein [Fulvivirga lutea]|uniref:Choice-of-anchor J domain-containing protein n=1 Tax=Fulvivirga lutea TaxID=2810512 RepID=A0A975A0E5_9BACT|nr:choice-of-anchor J domain-containing protein [Fulvivirga lutea]QSE96357.1 choice-of-anchor J domain-containing protein [Fulvivirga lutea]
MKKYILLAIISTVVFFIGCDEEDILDQSTVSYYPRVGTVVDEPEVGDTLDITVTLELSTRLQNASSAFISSQSLNVAYGQGFITEPEPVNGKIAVVFNEDETESSFKIRVFNNEQLTAATTINFIIDSFNGGINSAGQKKYTLKLSDIDEGGCNQFDQGTVLRNYTFGDCNRFATPDGFVELFAEGAKTDRGWGCDDGGVNASAFGGSAGSDDAYLIIEEPFNLDEIGNVLISFSLLSEFDGEGTVDLVYSPNYNGSEDPNEDGTVWISLKDVREQLPGDGSNTLVQVFSAPCIDKGSSVYFGFRYYDAPASDPASWLIDDLVFMKDDGEEPILFTEFSVPFEDNLDACNDFAIPGNFIQLRVPGSKSDRGWYCDGNGDGGSQALKAFASGGAAGAIDAWLISRIPFDFSDLTKAFTNFDIKVNSEGDGQLNVLWSENYSGTGDPSSFFTAENAIAVTLPSASSTFTNIEVDLTEAAGKVVYLAWQFKGATSANSVDFNLDNIAVTPQTTILTGLLTEDFNVCNELNSFSEFSVSGAQSWDCTNFGRDDSTGAQMSGFSGGAQDNEDWLISPSFVPAGTSTLIFDARTAFNGPAMEVKISTNYGGSGDPSTATWTDLSVTLPAESSDTWTTVDGISLNAFNGQTVHVAFVYYSSTADGAARWTLDNVVVTE